MNNDDRNRDYSLLLYSLSYIPPLNVIFRAYLILKSRWKPPLRCHHQLINRTPLVLLNSSCDIVFLGKKKRNHLLQHFSLSNWLQTVIVFGTWCGARWYVANRPKCHNFVWTPVWRCSAEWLLTLRWFARGTSSTLLSQPQNCQKAELWMMPG